MVDILRFDNGPVLPQSVIDDLQISKILPESAQKILCRPCGAANIPARFELFSLLDGELKAEISELISKLKEYSRAICRLRETKSALERLCLRLQIYEKYLIIAKSIILLEGRGELLSDLALYYRSNLPEELGDDIDRAWSILETIDNFYFLNSDKLWIAPASDSPSLNERFSELAQSLGISAQPQKERALALPFSVSDSLFMLFPAEFSMVRSIADKYGYIDLDELTEYIPQLEFFISVSDLICRSKLVHCIPEISGTPEFTAEDLYDVSLIAKKCDIVPNCAQFTQAERFFFLTGANGGGKTTYARALGINLILFLSGCPVFAKKARIYPFTSVLTHFPADERFTDSGRLDDELRRTEKMLACAGEIPFLIYNETFSGTDEARGYALLCRLTEKLRDIGAFGIFVTHFHEVENLGMPMLSAQIDAENENTRTFRIKRVMSSRSSFAADILKEYKLDKESLMEREAER